MLLQTLIGEFEHEVTNTRKLLQAVPASATGHKVTDYGWTLGELAQHIATIYHWYAGTLLHDVHDMVTDIIERGDPADIEATRDLFERNVEKARAAWKSINEEDLYRDWTMNMGERTIIGPAPRIQVARGFLFNHLYHHRGELVVYLRSSGNKVPGLYGPTYEESQAMRAAAGQ